MKHIGEVLEELRSNLAHLCLRDPERRTLVARTAFLFHRSEKTVYRQLAQVAGPKRSTRKDQGHARYPVESEFRRWIEMVAAIKLATHGITLSLSISAQRQPWKLPALPSLRTSEI